MNLQGAPMTTVRPFGLACLVLLMAAPASAQEPQPQKLLDAVTRSVLRDPATYAPALAKFSGMQLDWESSQIFFRHGFVERNERFTVSGRSNDVALSHGAGNRKIVLDSLIVLARSAPANFAQRSVEQLLIRKYPSHRKALTVAGHITRLAGSSYLTYATSFAHFQQWRRNERLARELGFK